MDGRRTSPAGILFRVDGDAAIGSGHLRRCLALAQQLRLLGRDCLFVCRAADRNFNYLVSDAGFDLIELPGRTVDLARDFQETEAAVAGHGPFAAVVVDQYGLDREWQQQMRSVAPRIVAIDDLCDRPHDCDLLVDVAPGDDKRYDHLVPAACRKLLGPRYALLRPEFARSRKDARQRTGAIERALISFGGADADDWTSVAIEAVRAVLPDVAIDAVVSSVSPHCDRLRQRADAKLSVHIDATNMAELMVSADVAIGAGGSTSWERACLGVPSIVTLTAENQRRTIEALESFGCAIAVPAGPGFGAELQQLIERLSKQPAVLRLMGKAGAAVVDGRGLSRVAAAIAAPEIHVRPVNADEDRKVWEWRNAPEVRATAVNSDEIPWEDHRAWFARRIADQRTIMLLGEEQGGDVGFVRFDLDGDAATVSIFLAPGQAGRGVGGALLRAGEAWIERHYPGITRFLADVRPENHTSIALFEGADYKSRLFSYERTVHDRDEPHDDRTS